MPLFKRSDDLKRQAEKRRSFFGDVPVRHTATASQHLHRPVSAYQALGATQQRAA